MANHSPASPVSISIDLKKYRIRIFKSTLHLLGDPPYIQLLVNPETRMVAIKPLEHQTSGDQAHKVSVRMMASDNSIEIYSRSFISRLNKVADHLDPGYTYKMTGTVISSQKIALFEMRTLTKVQIPEVKNGN